VTTPADIFETLAQLPDRTPAQRAADERSAAILRSRGELFPHYDEGPETWDRHEVEDIVAERVTDVLHELIDELPASSKRARELLEARVVEVAAS
jgi:hypothetical protein